MEVAAGSGSSVWVRASILENTGAPSRDQGHLQVEGAGAGPLRGRGLDRDPGLGDPGGDPDLGDPALDTVRPRWRRLNSSWSLTS